MTVLADTYLSLLRVIAGDIRRFKATLLILGRIGFELFMAIYPNLKHYSSRINVELFMAIFQPQSQHDPKHYNKGNAINIPHILWLRVAVADNEETSQNQLHPHDP